jgi:hypothetical protein
MNKQREAVRDKTTTLSPNPLRQFFLETVNIKRGTTPLSKFACSLLTGQKSEANLRENNLKAFQGHVTIS